MWIHLLYISSPTWEQVLQDSGLSHFLCKFIRTNSPHYCSHSLRNNWCLLSLSSLTIPGSPLVSTSSGLGGRVTQSLILSLCSPGLSWALAAALIHLSSNWAKKCQRTYNWIIWVLNIFFCIFTV